MSSILGSTITSGIYTLAISVVVLAVLSVLFGKTLGGHDKRKQKLISNITWAIGILLMSFFLLPKIFAQP